MITRYIEREGEVRHAPKRRSSRLKSRAPEFGGVVEATPLRRLRR